jgi:hypothetical protein
MYWENNIFFEKDIPKPFDKIKVHIVLSLIGSLKQNV